MKPLTKLVATGFSGLVIAGLVFVLLVSPALSKVSELHEESKMKKTELATLEQQIRAYQTAEADLSKAAQREKISDSFVSREDLVVAIQSVEKAAIVTRTEETKTITDKVENPVKGEKSKPVIPGKKLIEEVPYRLLIKNNYVGVVNFMRYLEHLPQFSEVTNITLSAETTSVTAGGNPIPTGQVLGTIDAAFFIKTYDSD
ncbi:MAG: hypothetical protein Q8P83_03050 [bacterium]|nr:hypothetical protein [bacterium]